MRRETESYGTVTVVRERPASVLANHTAKVEKLLKKPLPADFVAFYAKSDGLSYAALRDGVSLGLDETLCGTEAMFDGFKKHKQLRNEEAFDELDRYGAPFCGTVWSEDFEIEEKGDLARFNTMLRSKLLVSVAGQPCALVVDFAPKPKRGVAKEYEIILVSDGNDVLPLVGLDFPMFVWHFERFGAQGWFWAFVGEAGGETLNIDLVEAVEAGMSVFAPDFGKETEALVARARGGAT